RPGTMKLRRRSFRAAAGWSFDRAHVPAWLRLGKPDLRVTVLSQPTRAAMRTRVRIRGMSSACALLGMGTTEVAAPRPTLFRQFPFHDVKQPLSFPRHILRPALTTLLRQPGSSPETLLDDRGCRSPSMNSLRSQ